MKKILEFIKPYKVQAVMAPLFKMLEAIFELFVPLVMAAIIDTGIANDDKPYIFGMGGILILLGVVGLVSSVTAQYFSAKTAVNAAADLKSALFSHIQSFSFSQIDSLGASTLITRLTADVNQVQQGINMTLRLFLRSPFIVFGAMIMAFTIDVKTALVFVVAIPVLSVIVFWIILGTVPLYKKVQGNMDKMLVRVRENLTGVRVVRAFNMQEREKTAFLDENETYTASMKKAAGISALMNPLTYVVVNVALVVIIYSGAIRVDAGTTTQGQLIALVNYMSQILVELVKLANLIILMTKAAASANRVSDIFAIEAEPVENPAFADLPMGDRSKKVEFKDVSFRYGSAGSESLEHITFDAAVGDTIGIIGSTGSGKSTLAQLIPGFYKATEGAVYVDGCDTRTYNQETLKDKVGFCMQKYFLFKGNVRDNVTFGADNATDEDAIWALKTAQAYDFVMEKKGLETEITQGGGNLSGGQKQRLMIARALCRRPEILILDDSSSALDYATDKRLREAIKEVKDMTVFIISQRTATVAHCDKIIVLDDGHIAGLGTHEELLNTCDVYKEIYESQQRQ